MGYDYVSRMVHSCHSLLLQPPLLNQQWIFGDLEPVQ